MPTFFLNCEGSNSFGKMSLSGISLESQIQLMLVIRVNVNRRIKFFDEAKEERISLKIFYNRLITMMESVSAAPQRSFSL